MNKPQQKPILPDFPELPAKLRQIIGEQENRAWEKAIYDWLINSAVSSEIYVNHALNVSTSTSFKSLRVKILKAPQMNDGVNEFRNKIICQGDDVRDIYLVDVPLPFQLAVFAFIVGARTRFQTNFGDFAAGRVVGRGERNRFTYFTPTDSEEHLKETSVHEIWSPYYGGNTFSAYPLVSTLLNIPFVSFIDILPGTDFATKATKLTLPGFPNSRIFDGWKDINSHAARWTPINLIDGIMEGNKGQKIDPPYLNTFYDQSSYVPPYEPLG